MPIVSGLISDVTNRTMITGAWVRATTLRPSSTGGLTTDENSPVEMELEGTAARINMPVEPGPAVLLLTMGGEIVESVQLLVPDEDCTLADAWQAAQLATGHTQSALEALASRAAAAVIDAENAAEDAENAAVEARGYAENVADDSITSAKIADGAVTTTKLGPESVTSAKLGSYAVTSEKIAPDAVTTGSIENGAVTAEKIVNAAVTTEKLAVKSVTTEKIEDAAVTRWKIDDYAVTSAKLYNNAVTEEKIAGGAVTGPKIAPAYAQRASTRTVTLIQDVYSKVITAHKVGRVVHLAISESEPGVWSATLSTSSATPLRPALMNGQFTATQPGISGSVVAIAVSGTQFAVQFAGTYSSGNIHLSYLSDNSDPLI